MSGLTYALESIETLVLKYSSVQIIFYLIDILVREGKPHLQE